MNTRIISQPATPRYSRCADTLFMRPSSPNGRLAFGFWNELPPPTHTHTQVYGYCKPYAITGSLPCIRELQEAGYDGEQQQAQELAKQRAAEAARARATATMAGWEEGLWEEVGKAWAGEAAFARMAASSGAGVFWLSLTVAWARPTCFNWIAVQCIGFGRMATYHANDE